MPSSSHLQVLLILSTNTNIIINYTKLKYRNLHHEAYGVRKWRIPYGGALRGKTGSLSLVPPQARANRQFHVGRMSSLLDIVHIQTVVAAVQDVACHCTLTELELEVISGNTLLFGL